MTAEINVQYYPVVATADLSAAANDNTGPLHKVVTCNGAIAGAPQLAMGVLKSKGAIGESLSVAVRGVVKAFAGAAISTIGYPITVTTSGFITAAVSGGYMVGKAMEVCASGDLRPFLVDFTNIGYFVQ
jgi:hypothetical protein